MAHHVFEEKAACTQCKATGLYVGIAERDGAAVVCHGCEGSGEYTIRVEWDDFDGRRVRDEVTHVVEVNPGVCIGIGGNKKLELSDFGGMPYADWLDGQPFGRGSENRNFTCPAWWYQSANYSLKPEWVECQIGGTFSSCPSFPDKGACWSRWDRETPCDS